MSRYIIHESHMTGNTYLDPMDSFHLFYSKNFITHIRPNTYVKCLKKYLKFVAKKDEKFIRNLFFKNSGSTQNAYSTYWDKVLGNFESKKLAIAIVRFIKNSHKFNPGEMFDLGIPMKDAKYLDSISNPYYNEFRYDPEGIVEVIDE